MQKCSRSVCSGTQNMSAKYFRLGVLERRMRSVTELQNHPEHIFQPYKHLFPSSLFLENGIMATFYTLPS